MVLSGLVRLCSPRMGVPRWSSVWIDMLRQCKVGFGPLGHVFGHLREGWFGYGTEGREGEETIEDLMGRAELRRGYVGKATVTSGMVGTGTVWIPLGFDTVCFGSLRYGPASTGCVGRGRVRIAGLGYGKGLRRMARVRRLSRYQDRGVVLATSAASRTHIQVRSLNFAPMRSGVCCDTVRWGTQGWPGASNAEARIGLLGCCKLLFRRDRFALVWLVMEEYAPLGSGWTGSCVASSRCSESRCCWQWCRTLRSCLFRSDELMSGKGSGSLGVQCGFFLLLTARQRGSTPRTATRSSWACLGRVWQGPVRCGTLPYGRKRLAAEGQGVTVVGSARLWCGGGNGH